MLKPCEVCGAESIHGVTVASDNEEPRGERWFCGDSHAIWWLSKNLRRLGATPVEVVSATTEHPAIFKAPEGKLVAGSARVNEAASRQRSRASAIVARLCNEHRNSDLRADNLDIIAAFDAEFEAIRADQKRRDAEIARSWKREWPVAECCDGTVERALDGVAAAIERGEGK